MSTQSATNNVIHFPPPEKPLRSFHLTWDNSKMRIDPRERYKRREAIGVHFSPKLSTGKVALDNGNVFDSMGELKHHLEVAGVFELVYDDEEMS